MTSSNYCSYTWSPLRAKSADPDTENSYTFTIKSRNFPRQPDDGLYQLYYHSSMKEILAVSHPFSLTEKESPSLSLHSLND